MYGISHIASTPRTSSTDFNGEHRHSLSQRVFPSYACDFLDDDPAYEHCSTNTPPGSLSICRHSPRLLSNGYYIWTEDSFLSDEEGNITLTPSQTSVTYKENLVRVFRRRKKIRRSLASLFSLDASTSCSSTIPSNVDSSHLDDPWPDECNELEASQSDVGDSNVSSEYNSYDSHVSQRQAPAPNSKEDNFLQPEKPFCVSKSSFPFMINANEDLEQCRIQHSAKCPDSDGCTDHMFNHFNMYKFFCPKMLLCRRSSALTHLSEQLSFENNCKKRIIECG